MALSNSNMQARLAGGAYVSQDCTLLSSELSGASHLPPASREGASKPHGSHRKVWRCNHMTGLLNATAEVMQLLARTDAWSRSRYIVTGFFRRPGVDAAGRTGASLKAVVMARLRLSRRQQRAMIRE